MGVTACDEDVGKVAGVAADVLVEVEAMGYAAPRERFANGST